MQNRIETNHRKTNVIGATRFSVFTIRFTVRHLLAVPLTLALAYSLRYSSFSPAYLHSLAFFRMFSSYRSNGGLTLLAENSNAQLSLFQQTFATRTKNAILLLDAVASRREVKNQTTFSTWDEINISNIRKYEKVWMKYEKFLISVCNHFLTRLLKTLEILSLDVTIEIN